MKTVECRKLPDVLEFGPYRLDTRDQLLFKNGSEVHLTPKVVELLLVLLKNHGHVVEKDDLMRELWPDTIVEENNLTRNISTLRKMLNAESGEDEYIETIPRRGYRFVAEVREVNEPNPITEVTESGHQRAPVASSLAALPEVATREAEATEKRNAPSQTSARAAAGVLKYARPGVLHGSLLLLLVVVLLLWLSRFAWPTQEEKPAGTFPQLRLNRHPTKRGPQIAALSPDGKYVAYAADEFGKQSLYFSQINTDNAKRLMPPAESPYEGLTFAPDGSHLYFTRREVNQLSTLYRLAVLSDEPPQKLVSLRSSSPVGLSPDGSQIAFIREQAAEGVSALLIANTDGSAERKLAERKRPDFFSLTGSPSWSADGRILVFVIGSVVNGIRYQLASIELTHDSRLTIHRTQWPWIYQAAWLPGGRELLLLADEQPGGFRDQLWRMTWPEGRPKRITNDLNDYHGISIAADSDALVTVQSNHLSDIWVVPQQTGGRSQRITPYNERQEGLRGLDWTPDGRLVFSLLENGRDQIWSMHADGSQRRDLTLSESADSNNYSPSVSPDGGQVVFVSDRQGQTRIWRMTIDGGQPHPLTEGHDDLGPQVSSDGQWVIYSSAKSGHRALWKVPLAGGPETLVSDLPAEASAISPTGNLIACTWREDVTNLQRKLAVIDLADRQPPRYLALPAGSTWLRWLPNGKALTYNLTRNGLANLWSQTLAGGPPTQLTDLSFENVASFAWSRDGGRLALARAQEIRSVVFINGLK